MLKLSLIENRIYCGCLKQIKNKSDRWKYSLFFNFDMVAIIYELHRNPYGKTLVEKDARIR